ncbi:MAG: hypothetical protein QGD94_01675 [Planctomycetia bacterium]|nr:hypothetical protein [Planctomycetia bacterium]
MGKKLSAAIVLAVGLLVVSGVAFGQQDVQKKLDKQQQQLDAQQQLIETLQKKLSELEKSSREATLTKDEFDKLKKEIEAAVDKLVKQYGPLDFRVFWKEGLRLESGNGQFKMKIGGRIMNDWAWMRAERDVRKAVVAGTPIGVLEDGTEFRRVRLYIAGTMYGNIDI